MAFLNTKDVGPIAIEVPPADADGSLNANIGLSGKCRSRMRGCSVTAYDRQTHALIKNVARASRASNSAEVTKNANGSVDLYFGPTAPAGKESNWVPTDPARAFELMLRLYAPTKALFDKTWKLPDVESSEWRS